MSTFLKGSQHHFIFDFQDNNNLISRILEDGFALFEDYVDNEEEKNPLLNMDKFKKIISKSKYTKYNTVPLLRVVQKTKIDSVVWEIINLNSGGTRYTMDPMRSHAVNLHLPNQNSERIGIGSISVCTEWEDEKGRIFEATHEVEDYKKLKKFIRKLSCGKIGTITVGKNTYRLWYEGKIALAPDLRNPEIYELKHYKPLKQR